MRGIHDEPKQTSIDVGRRITSIILVYTVNYPRGPPVIFHFPVPGVLQVEMNKYFIKRLSTSKYPEYFDLKRLSTCRSQELFDLKRLGFREFIERLYLKRLSTRESPEYFDLK